MSDFWELQSLPVIIPTPSEGDKVVTGDPEQSKNR